MKAASNNLFVPARLRDARIARGFSLAELGLEIGVTSQAVSKYELGQSIPSATVLVSIANTLEFPINYFYKPKNIVDQNYSNSAVYFRSMKSTPKKYKLAYRTRVEWIDEVYRFLSQYVNFPQINIPEFAELNKLDDLDNEDIERIAIKLRDHWNMGRIPIDNLTDILQENGFVLAQIKFGINKIDAFSQWYNGIPYIVLGTDKNSACRSRFDLAHELGHLILHSHITDEDLAKKQVLDKIESEANTFAGAFLLPSETFANEVISTSLDHFVILKERWKVSIVAMIMRCKELGLFNDNQINYLFRQRSSRRINIKEPLDDVIKFNEPYMIKQAMQLIIDHQILLPDEILDTLAYNKYELEQLFSLPEKLLERKARLSPLNLKVINSVS